MGRISGVLSGAVGVIGALTLIGWSTGIGVLTSYLAGQPVMVPLTALGLILAAAAMLLLPGRGGRASPHASIALGVAVAALGALVLAEYLLTIDLGLDRILFIDRLRQAQASLPGRPSPNTAFNLTLIGSALALIAGRRVLPLIAGQVCALIVALNALRAIIGYVYGAVGLYAISASTGVAIHTAVSFLLLGIAALFARAGEGMLSIPHSDAVRRNWAPAVLLFIVVAPGLITFFTVWNDHALLLGPGLEPILLIAVNCLTLWWFSWMIARSDRQRQDANEARNSSEEILRLVVSQMPATLWTTDHSLRLTSVQGADISRFGQPERYLGQKVSVLLGDDEAGRAGIEAHQRALAGEGSFYERSVTGRSYNVRTEPLRNLQGAIVGCVGQAIDISEQKAAEAEIRRLNAELEERVQARTAQLEQINRELEAFSYSVSHDLRAPLRGIDGFSQALIEDYGDRLDDEGRDYLRRVRSNTQRMGSLIDSLLDLSRVSRGQLALGQVSLSAMAADIIADLRAGAPGRAVEVSIAPGLTAVADRRLLGAALTNLLENAWKFTAGRSPAQIALLSQGEGDEEIFIVRDNGAGFDPAQAARLFTPFQRLHSAGEFPGTGVGLATVQRIIHRHGGRIWAESWPDAGATFFFTLSGRAAASGEPARR